MSETRELHEIAREIDLEWRHPYFGAVPYIVAMRQLTTITSSYYEDDGKSVVLYFLSNAKTWRGDVARRIKAELKALIK